jgi:aryl-alcohol dehydrogenase-like predicted oxidoreductase
LDYFILFFLDLCKRSIEDGESTQAIRVAFEAGITTVDTAEIYGEGHSESIVAQALADVRERVVYATKVGSSVCVMQWTGFIRDGTLI